MIGWYFSTGVLGHGDGRPVVVGETHEVEGPLELCHRGLHASERVIDALRYAPGAMLYKVELSGDIVRGDDKACATRRAYLAWVDATEILRAFARRCALDVAHLWDAPAVVLEYLKTGDEALRDAADAAAWAAVWAAVWAATGAATGDAARDEQNRVLTEMVESALLGARC